jgi:hypothetical protein
MALKPTAYEASVSLFLAMSACQGAGLANP